MSDEHPTLPRRTLRILGEIVVALYVVADSAASLLFRPVMSFLSGLQIVQRLERGINALPPYVILVLMVVPFAIAEFAKVFAIFWMSEGHFHTGMIIFVGAYIVSIFVCERILHAGKNKLMTIGWFAACYTWIMAFRDQIFGWFRETSIWKASIGIRDKTQNLLQRSTDRLRSLFGRKPRNALERR